ncbi:MAG: T9SS type A sorting domain-containing protein [Chitinophagaceae bacterium]
MKATIRLTLLLFSFILTLHQAGFTQVIQVGKSYINISKGTSGGTIEPGDTLEIRATIAVGNWDNSQITLTHYVDTIPANVTYVANSLKILTNEGVVFNAFTDASDGDQAMSAITGTLRTLRINLGSTYNGGNAGTVSIGTACTTTAPSTTGGTGGRIRWDGRPSFYAGVCIMSASYRIVIPTSLAYGTQINTYGGAFWYRVGTATLNTNKYLSPYKIVLTQNLGLCSNAIGANAVLENGGTFGSGTAQNRSTSAIVPGYTFTSVTTGQPNDGSYAIINNLSPSGNTNPNSQIPNSTNRVFGYWDIMGDHTNATNVVAGNNPVAPGANGGYFVAINASYANSNAIQQTVSGLCPNTYYEFSAWFKNVCRYCACDMYGTGPYNGTTPNSSFKGTDSSGVNPNLTFTIDGLDYYTTGTMKYTGQWVKKGFIYLTGPSQTSFTMTIRNNAPGGGGNDWGIDDVTLATCTPNLDMRPSPSLKVCAGDQVDVYAIVRCFFPNYIYWRWEKSTDNGANWSLTGVSGTATPVANAGEYEYTAAYPSFLATANSIYRLRIASTSGNLDNTSCSFVASTTITIGVDECITLNSSIKNFSGKVVNKHQSVLQWTVTGETSATSYEVESSDDKVHYNKIGTVYAPAATTGDNSYQFTDPNLLNGVRYYRIKIKEANSSTYSKVVVLISEVSALDVRTLINPFKDKISFDLVSPSEQPTTVSLLDMYGRVIKRDKITALQGITPVQLTGLSQVAAGMYILQIQQQDVIISKQVLKAEQR